MHIASANGAADQLRAGREAGRKSGDDERTPRDRSCSVLRSHEPPQREHDERRERPLVHRVGKRSQSHRGGRADHDGACDGDPAFARAQIGEQNPRELVYEETRERCRDRQRERDDARRPTRADHPEERKVEQRIVVRLDLCGRDVPIEDAAVPPRPRVVVVVVLHVPVGVLPEQGRPRARCQDQHEKHGRVREDGVSGYLQESSCGAASKGVC